MANDDAPHRKTPLAAEEVEPESCTLDLRTHLLSRAPFFAGLPPEHIADINRFFHERAIVAGQAVYSAGEPATRLYIVAAGKVKLLRHTLAGQDVLLDILGPGEYFGSLSELGDDEYQDTARPLTAGCALAVSAEDFDAILRRYPPVALAVLGIVARRLKAAQEVIRQLSVQPVEGRVAATLLKLADKLGEARAQDVLIQTPLTRQDLADMAGTTLETASRIVAQFRKAGLIDSGRQWIAVRDRAALEELAQA